MNISSLKISGSALTASRVRLDTISENIANANTTRTENGKAYRRREVVYESIPHNQPDAGYPHPGGTRGGVRVTEVVESDRQMERIYKPGHPDADADGYVEMPNVNLVEEMVDMMTATRAYEANVAAVNATKTLVARALDLGRG